MINRTEYKQLKAETNKYTVDQANALSVDQVRTLSKAADTVTVTFVKNMKRLLIAELQRVQDAVDEKEMKDVLNAGFPDWKNTTVGKELDEKLTVQSIEVTR